MEVKRNGNNVNIYDGERLILHLDKNSDTFTAVNDGVRISAKIEKMSDTATKFSEVSLKKNEFIRENGKKYVSKMDTALYSMA